MSGSGFFDSNGRELALGEEIGRGGEGVVLALADFPLLCVKIYSKLPDQDRVDKLAAMVEAFARDPTLTEWCAWPRELLRNEHGQVCGFVMDRLHDLAPVHELYDPEERKRRFPLLTWQDLVQAAAFCAAMFAALHQHDVVVGDVNERNVLVRPDGRLHLVDCDSFQIRVGGRVFRTGVGVPDYTPPELQGGQFGALVRTVNHDRFGLAVLCFKLVFMGRHPFAGGASGEIGPAIAAHDYAYPGLALRLRHLLPVAAVPDDLQALFADAFLEQGDDHRPEAERFTDALLDMAEGLRPCPVEPMHRIAASSRQCPWCQIESVLAYHWFEPPEPEAWVSGFSPQLAELEALRKEMATISAPPKPEWWEDPPALQGALRLAERVCAAGPRHDVKAWYVRALGGLATLAGVASLAAEPGPARWLAPAGIGVWLGGWWWGRKQVKPWQTALHELRTQADAVRHASDDWRGEAWRRGEADRKLLAQFEADATRYAALEDDRKRALAKMMADVPDQQVLPRLQKITLEHASLPPFVDHERRSSLRIRGLHAASDVVRERLMTVPGLSNAHVEALVRWRQALEVQLGGQRRPPPSDDALSALDRRMEQERQRLAASLTQLVSQRRVATEEAVQLLDETWRKAQTDAERLHARAESLWQALSDRGGLSAAGHSAS